MLSDSRIQHRARRCLIVMPEFQLSNAASELPGFLLTSWALPGRAGRSGTMRFSDVFGGGVRPPAEVPEVECTKHRSLLRSKRSVRCTAVFKTLVDHHHGPEWPGFAEQVSVLVVHAAVLSALNFAGSARWKDWGVVHILEVGALTVDFLLTGLANLGDGNGCAHHCEYRKTSANRGQ